MRDIQVGMKSAKSKVMLWLLVGAGLLLVLLANSHLVYVAFVSQPDCVPHVRQGELGSEGGIFSAAKSACTPR